MTEQKTRLPSWDDVVSLCKELNKMGVEYALIGGSAMSVYGYERQTKDVDFLLPRDEANTRKMVEVMKHHPLVKGGFATEIEESLLHGVSTAISDEILVDMLFVAAERGFADLHAYVVTHDFHGTPIKVMNLDGLLKTKETSRDSDRADRANIKRALAIINEQSRKDLLERLLSEPVIAVTDLEHGLYEGAIIAKNRRHLAQETARGCIIHEKMKLVKAPMVGDNVKIRYSGKMLADVRLMPENAKLVVDGQYCGPVVVVHSGYVVQDAGRKVLIAHSLVDLGVVPVVDERIEVEYKSGKAKVREEKKVDRNSMGRE